MTIAGHSIHNSSSIKVTKLEDNPGGPEVFSDGVSTFWANQNFVRMTLHSDQMNQEGTGEITRVAVARLVLPVHAAKDMFDKLHVMFGQDGKAN